MLTYRVSHETSQLENSFECLLQHTVLDTVDTAVYLTHVILL